MGLTRIWHPYTEWEEFHHGMWRRVGDNQHSLYLANAIAFTGDHELYGSYMMEVSRLWIRSCEHNLTNISINRRAWIGHAACCLAIGCPESITRSAWGHLSIDQKRSANAQAQSAIESWEERHSA